MNTLERILAIFLSIISSVVFAYIMNSIGEIINAIQQAKAEALKKMRNMNIFLSQMEIEKDLQFKITKYIDYMYDERHQYMLEGNGLL